MVDETCLPEAAHFALREHATPRMEVVTLPLGVTHPWLLVAFSHRLLLATIDGWESFGLDSSTNESQ